MNNDIAERVKQIVVSHLGVPETNVSDTSRFTDDPGADSLDTVELAMAFEDEFVCEILDHAATIVTVEDAVILVEQIA
jgi:acyl carrier protein